MLRINPFRAIRPDIQTAARVASLPYDVVNTEEARKLAADNPSSFLHVVRSEIDLPVGTNPYDQQVYAKARANLEALLAAGTMLQDDEPAVFLYRQVRNHRTQIGLVCCCHVDDYRNDLIKKHEKTRKVKEDDRTKHVLTVNAHTGPVFLTYKRDASLEHLIRDDTNERPMFHFNAPDGVTHTVWRANKSAQYIAAFARVPCAYVADGHHRAASAFRAAEQRRANNPNHTGNEEYNWFLSVLFPHHELTILAYNRVVADLNNLSAEQFLNQLQSIATVQQSTTTAPAQPGTFCMYLERTWYTITLNPDLIDKSDPVESLDVALLQSRILEPMLGTGDPRSDERIDFVGGIHGPSRLEEMVNDGRAAVAFVLYPTSVQQLMDVADAGLIMPPKSTWFEPKLRSGLLVHSLE